MSKQFIQLLIVFAVILLFSIQTHQQDKEMCVLHAGGIIGPYLFLNEQGAAVMVNGECYRAMLTEFLFPAINQLNISGIWFQLLPIPDYYLCGRHKKVVKY